MSSEYTKAQAARIAEQIHQRFGALISAACKGTLVPPPFLAGFIGVEAGKDRKGQIKPEATRFEAGVFADLKSLRDTGICEVAGKLRTTYNGVRQAQIKDADDTALRALATSYGLTQAMGWHVVNNLKCTINDLRDLDKHLIYAVRLLVIVSGNNLQRKEYDDVLRIWNTGSENGKTYHEDYVANALAVMREYAALNVVQPAATPIAPSAAPVQPTQNAPVLGNLIQKAEDAAQCVEQAKNTIDNVRVQVGGAIESGTQIVAEASKIVPIEGGGALDYPLIRVFNTAKVRVFQWVTFLLSVPTILGGFVLNNWMVIVAGVVLLALIVYLVVQIQLIKAQINSNPQRYNVE